MTSLRQLARIIGVDDKSIRKAEAAGVFGAAVQRDAAGVPGVVDVAEAIAAWERSGRQLRGTRSKPDAADAPAPASLPSRPTSDTESVGPIDDDESPEAPPALSSTSLVEAQRLAMLERGRRLKLDNDAKEGLLVDVEHTRNAAFEFARVLREAILGVPGRIAAQLAAESDAGRVHLQLENALREALETTAATMEAAPPPPSPAGAAAA